MRGYGLGLIKYEVPGCGVFWGHNGVFDGTRAEVLVSDDGRRHFSYVLTMSGYQRVVNGMPVPTPIGDALKKLRKQAVNQALCDAGAREE